MGRTVLSAASILAAPGADYDETFSSGWSEGLLAPELAGLVAHPGATPSGYASDVHGLTSVEETIAQSGINHPVPGNQSETDTGDTTTELSTQFDAHLSSNIAVDARPGVHGSDTALNETVSETVNHSPSPNVRAAGDPSKSMPSQAVKDQKAGPDEERTPLASTAQLSSQNASLRNEVL